MRTLQRTRRPRSQQQEAFMNRNKIIITILISVAGLSLAAAQTPRRRTSPPATKPAPADNSAVKTNTPTAQPSPTQPAEVSPPTLALANDVPLSPIAIQDNSN